MSFVHGVQFVLIGLRQIKKLLVPILVELLVLFDVSLFTLLSLVLVVKSHFFHLTLEVLLFEFSDSVLSHLSFNIASFGFTLNPELLSSFDELSNVLSINFVILTCVGWVFEVLIHL